MKERDCDRCSDIEHRLCVEVFEHTRKRSCESSTAVIATIINRVNVRERKERDDVLLARVREDMAEETS